MTAGTLANSFLGLLFYILVARSLSVAGFGYFSYLLALGLLGAEVSDLGLSSALVKFGSADNFPASFTLVAGQRVAVGILVSLIFIVLSLFGDHLLIYSAAVAVSLIFFQGLISQSLIARQKYEWFVGANLAGNLLRLFLVFVLANIGLLTTVSTLVVFCLANGLSALVGSLPVVSQFGTRLISLSSARRILPSVFRYSRWLAVSYGLASVSAKIDMPLIYGLSGGVAAGVYSSAQKLTSVFPQVMASVEGVFAPKLSRGDSPLGFRGYLLVASLLAAGSLILILLSPGLILLVFGAKYLNSIPIFQWLMVGIALFFLSGPFSTGVVYQKGRTVYHLGGSALQLVMTVSLYLLLIPTYGILGAAFTFVASQAFNLLYYLMLWRKA